MLSCVPRSSLSSVHWNRACCTPCPVPQMQVIATPSPFLWTHPLQGSSLAHHACRMWMGVRNTSRTRRSSARHRATRAHQQQKLMAQSLHSQCAASLRMHFNVQCAWYVFHVYFGGKGCWSTTYIPHHIQHPLMIAHTHPGCRVQTHGIVMRPLLLPAMPNAPGRPAISPGSLLAVMGMCTKGRVLPTMSCCHHRNPRPHAQSGQAVQASFW